MLTFLMICLCKNRKGHGIQTQVKGVTSLVPMNHLDKTLETDYLGSEGVVLQSSQVDRGHGVAKPDGVEQVSPVLESR